MVRRAGNMLWTSLPPSLKRRSGIHVSAADDGFDSGDTKHWEYGPRYHQDISLFTVCYRLTKRALQTFKELFETIFIISIVLSTNKGVTLRSRGCMTCIDYSLKSKSQ